ncbi:MAG: glutaredoxin domain-containing protein [Bacteroidota bacterium]
MEAKLELYGTNWCMKSANLRNYMQSKWIGFDDYNVEEDQDAEQRVRALYDGKLKFPTLKYGEDFLKNPSISELNTFLESKGLDQ